MTVQNTSHSSLLPDLADLISGWAPVSGLRPLFGSHVIRVEDQVENGRYVVRAEIPDVDPAKDIDVTVRDGQLTIKAERTEKHVERGRSEFSYGSFARSVTLPTSADLDDVDAAYDRGILTVSVAVGKPENSEKHIEVIDAGSTSEEPARKAGTSGD